MCTKKLSSFRVINREEPFLAQICGLAICWADLCIIIICFNKVTVMHWPGGHRKESKILVINVHKKLSSFRVINREEPFLAQVCGLAICWADLCIIIICFQQSNGNALAGRPSQGE